MKVWIHINGIQEGPYQLEELPLNRIKPDTPVWYEGLDYWKEASQAPEVARLLAQRPVPEVSVEVEPNPEPEVTTIVTPAPEPVEVEIAGQPEQSTEPVASEPEVSVVNEQPQPESESEPEPQVAPEPQVEPEQQKAPEQPQVEPEQQAEPQPQPQAEPQPQTQADPRELRQDDPMQWQQHWADYKRAIHQQPYQQPYGQPYQGAPEGEKAPTYLVVAILVTVLCCNPLGIIAIFTAAATGRRNSNYDFAGAKRMSETTAWWIMIAIVTSLIVAPFISIGML